MAAQLPRDRTAHELVRAARLARGLLLAVLAGGSLLAVGVAATSGGTAATAVACAVVAYAAVAAVPLCRVTGRMIRDLTRADDALVAVPVAAPPRHLVG